MKFIETSALDSSNIEPAFTGLVEGMQIKIAIDEH